MRWHIPCVIALGGDHHRVAVGYCFYGHEGSPLPGGCFDGQTAPAACDTGYCVAWTKECVQGAYVLPCK